MRIQKGKHNKNRLQNGQGIGDVLIKLAKALGPTALKALESSIGPIGESIGKKIGKLIEGKGIDGDQGLSASSRELMGSGSKLAGGGSKLAGGGFRLAGEKKKICA